MTDSALAHPPTTGAPVASRRQSAPAWPVVIGLGGLVYALLHITAAGGAILLLYFAVGAGPSGIHFFPNTAVKPTALHILPFGVLALMNLPLLLGSILILKRRRSGTVMCRWWAWAYACFLIVWMFLGFFSSGTDQAIPQAAQRVRQSHQLAIMVVQGLSFVAEFG